jgi:hypothetical protein
MLSIVQNDNKTNLLQTKPHFQLIIFPGNAGKSPSQSSSVSIRRRWTTMGIEMQSRRGRPKGSGIDDSATLQRVAELMGADPDLKPTTAIRMLGIDDPSTIRRLRDKLKTTHVPAGLVSADVGLASQPIRPPRTMAAAVANDDEVIREAPRLRVVPSQREDSARTGFGLAAMGPAATIIAPLFALWLDVGFRAASMALDAQQAMMMQWARTPVVQSAIRQHIAFNELAMAHLVPASPRARTKT